MANTSTRAKKKEEITDDVGVEQAAKKPVVPKEIDPHQMVTVINGFQGRLLYKNDRTHERIVWPHFGAEQEMELQELRAAKNSFRKYFSSNWFMFREDWIPVYLGVSKYYKNAIPIDSFDDIFELKGKDLEKRINGLTNGQKQSVAYRARTLIKEQKIDSLSTINVLENALGIELVDK